jgi:uncharacterized protein YggU (UPF0235/DUF167 family)
MESRSRSASIPAAAWMIWRGCGTASCQAKVTAAPVDGKANRRLCKLIAKRVGVPPSRVSVVRGERSRDKLVRVEGASPATVRAALEQG